MTGVLAVLTRTLLNHKDLRFRTWFEANAASMKRHKLKRVAFQLREAGGPDYIDLVLMFAERLPKSRELGLCALALCLRHDKRDQIEAVLQVYGGGNAARRMLLVTMLGSHLQTPFGFDLAVRILAAKESPSFAKKQEQEYPVVDSFRSSSHFGYYVEINSEIALPFCTMCTGRPVESGRVTFS